MRKGLQQDVIKKLEDIVGENHVLKTDDVLEKYSKDETIGLQAWPDAAVRVRSADEVSRVLRLANEYSIPVTPRGLGTSLSGGSVPINGGIVLSMERMDQLLEIDQENLMAVTEPGIITAELHRLVEEQGCFYPPDPASKDSCSIWRKCCRGIRRTSRSPLRNYQRLCLWAGGGFALGRDDDHRREGGEGCYRV